MRTFLFVGWLMVPVVVAAWHYGPGQEKMQLDRVAAVLAEADAHAAAGEYALADEKYEEALRLLPPGRPEARQIRLERAKSQMQCAKLPQAHDDLQALVEELTSDSAADPKLLAEARAASAGASYYMTWLMRLEGQPREQWGPEIESARQTYRLLAEEAEKQGNGAAAINHKKDLEAAIRLARMELSDLQGLPLPSQ